MASVVFFLAGFYAIVSSVDAYAGGGWNGAHATFYGGSDASGTMGMCTKTANIWLWPLWGFLTNSWQATWKFDKTVQVGLVDMATYTVKVMEQTLLLWVRLFSTMDWAVGLALKLSAQVTLNGVCQAPFWSRPQTSALQTVPSPTTLEAGAMLHCSTLIYLSLSSNTLLSTKQELYQSPTEGELLKQRFKLQGMFYIANYLI